MLHVRNFESADEMTAYYKALKQKKVYTHCRSEKELARFRRTLAKQFAFKIVPVKGLTIYREPIGPVRILRDYLVVATPPSQTAATRIIREVCEKHGVTKDDLRSERRRHSLVLAKREVCFRLKRETAKSFPQIGAMLGKDHTTILYNFYKHLDENPDAVHLSDEAGLASWRISNARNTERNKNYWVETRKAREIKRRNSAYLAAREGMQ